MVSFGFLTIYPDQEQHYATEIAKRGYLYGITCCRFTPFSIDPKDGQIHGERYDHTANDWKKAVFPLPDFIYDRCFYKDDSCSKRARPIVQWLKTNPLVTFLGSGLPSKLDVYEVLKNEELLAPYLPKTYSVQSSLQVLQLLKKERKVLLKPDKGSQGKGIFSLSLHPFQLKALSQTGKKITETIFENESSFHQWVNRRIQQGPLLAQPLLSINGWDGKPFDIRILMQKDRGQWKETGRGIRKAPEGYIVTNISNGAEVLSFEEGIKGFPEAEKQFISSEINSLLPLIPKVLESAFSPMFEIGIDICIDRNGAVWILDINSKPGRKIVLATSPNREEELYRKPLDYCHYLSQQSVTT